MPKFDGTEDIALVLAISKETAEEDERMRLALTLSEQAAAESFSINRESTDEELGLALAISMSESESASSAASSSSMEQITPSIVVEEAEAAAEAASTPIKAPLTAAEEARLTKHFAQLTSGGEGSNLPDSIKSENYLYRTDEISGILGYHRLAGDLPKDSLLLDVVSVLQNSKTKEYTATNFNNNLIAQTHGTKPKFVTLCYNADDAGHYLTVRAEIKTGDQADILFNDPIYDGKHLAQLIETMGDQSGFHAFKKVGFITDYLADLLKRHYGMNITKWNIVFSTVKQQAGGSVCGAIAASNAVVFATKTHLSNAEFATKSTHYEIQVPASDYASIKPIAQQQIECYKKYLVRSEIILVGEEPVRK
jgi:hypothetical protein